MHTLRTLALATLSLTLVGCSDGDDAGEPAPLVLRVATYNAGLAVGFVDAAQERAPLTTAAAAALPTDVLCVQEFWRSGDVDALASAAASSLPHQLFPAPQPDTNPGAPACQASDLTALETCVNTNCADACDDQIVDCALTNCQVELLGIPSECQACLQANIGGTLESIQQICTSGSVAYAYGGAFGTGLLSSAPIVAQEEHVFDSTTNRRSVLYAQLDTDVGPVHAFCTHLTAVFDSIEYPRPTGSWEEEQAAQIDEMLAYIDGKAGAGGMVVLMGDMNTGPAGDGYAAEVPAHYDKFIAAGYANPYIDRADEPCTFCFDNPLITGTDHSDSGVIDHVLLRGFAGTAGAERILDGSLDLPEYCGAPATVAYSDHYGVLATISVPQ
jgi:endonuclease/exonuclease/phosphatase family metal-dependent hydrolase